jgi:hypothetical protein
MIAWRWMGRIFSIREGVLGESGEYFPVKVNFREIFSN